jgi:hypothetical protein
MHVLYIKHNVSPFFSFVPKVASTTTPLGALVQSSSPFAQCLDTQNEKHVLPSETTIQFDPNFLIMKH